MSEERCRQARGRGGGCPGRDGYPWRQRHGAQLDWLVDDHNEKAPRKHADPLPLGTADISGEQLIALGLPVDSVPEFRKSALNRVVPARTI